MAKLGSNRAATTGPSEQINMIGQGTVIDGTVRAQSDLRISGTVKGTVQVAGRVVVTGEGVIEGEVIAANAHVDGKVEGTVTVEARLVLGGTAVIQGDIRTSKLVVEDGAVFTGKCDMSGLVAPKKGNPANPSSEANKAAA